MTSNAAADRVRIERKDTALIATFCNPPLNVIDQPLRQGLDDLCAEAERLLAEGAIDRIVLTGSGKAFVAGADVREFDAPPLAPHLPEVLTRLAALPAIVAINGTALGGGFEIALACRIRIAAPSATMGLPEAILGVLPGAGGTQRLPRLIGIAKAVPLISTGRAVAAREALDLGMIDGLDDAPLAAALALAGTDLARPAIDDLPAPTPAPEAAEAARRVARKRMPGQIAPLRAIDLVEASAFAPVPDMLPKERASFLELRKGAQARALRRVFFAERAAARPAALRSETPAPLETALVVGGGTMGRGIAYALSNAGMTVTLLEQTATAAEAARAGLQDLFAQAVARGKVTPDEAAQRLAKGFAFLHGSAPLPPVDIAIEAIVEDLPAKQALFRQLSETLPERTILVTNTSYLDPDQIAADLHRPERFLGLHFFAPAHIMSLLEIVRAERTSPATLATGFALARRLGKVAVEAGICEGFIGNRILTRYRGAADRLLLEGALPWQIDAAMTGFGMAMGPYQTQDLSGLDIAHANRSRHGEVRRSHPDYVAIADRLVEDLGRLGRKSKGGWYDYTEGRAVPSDDVRHLIEACSSEAGVVRREISADMIRKRLLEAMIAEARAILDEGIARRPEDIDLVMIHGYGFPRWRGGPMALAEERARAASPKASCAALPGHATV